MDERFPQAWKLKLAYELPYKSEKKNYLPFKKDIHVKVLLQ